AIVKQRLALASFSTLDLTDVDRMVAGLVGVDHPALEMGKRVVQDRHAVGAEPVGDALELLAAADREPARKLLLGVAQDVDGEEPALSEAGIALGLLVDT